MGQKVAQAALVLQLNKEDMEGFLIVMGGVGVMAAAFYFWLRTKRGQAWLDQL